MFDTHAPTSARPARLHWRWMLIGVLFGAVLITAFATVVWEVLPEPDVLILVGALTCVLTGVCVGFFSPEEAALEPALSGALLTALSGAVLGGTVELRVTPLVAAGVLPAGFLLAMVGGWVGDLMRETLAPGADPQEAMQWPWIAGGIAIGAVLNAYFVFMGVAVFGLRFGGLLVVFALSFVVVGLFVGLFSPGVTLLEPALAGVGLLVVDVVVTGLGFSAHFPVAAIAIAVVGAFVLSLLGGWIGDRIRRWFRPGTIA